VTGFVERMIARARAPLSSVRPVLASRYETDRIRWKQDGAWPVDDGAVPTRAAPLNPTRGAVRPGDTAPSMLVLPHFVPRGPERVVVEAPLPAPLAERSTDSLRPAAPVSLETPRVSEERPSAFSNVRAVPTRPLPLASVLAESPRLHTVPTSRTSVSAARPQDPEGLGMIEEVWSPSEPAIAEDHPAPSPRADPAIAKDHPTAPRPKDSRSEEWSRTQEHAAATAEVRVGTTEVSISIGHIEVRAAPAPEPRRPPARRPRVTLEEFLRRRDGSGR
jgi:hypothetical protein